MIAAKLIADAPLGHSVTIQKSATAPIVTNARPGPTLLVESVRHRTRP